MSAASLRRRIEKLGKATEQKGRRAIEVGPVGKAVAHNVARLRALRGWSTRDLAQRTEEAGRLIEHSGISRIEAGARRVDVDDLATLAYVLQVSIAALMTPPRELEKSNG